MSEIIDCLKAKNNSCSGGSIKMDSHECFEYLHRIQSGAAKYDKPCRWVISAHGAGYNVEQFDLSLYVEEVNGIVGWENPSHIDIMERGIRDMSMVVVECARTSSGAYNVFLQDTDDPGIIVNLLIVTDYIEKIQLINQHDDTQTVFKSSLDKISFMELPDKYAIFQVGYQMMASASPTRTLGPKDDRSIDELIRSTCYNSALGNVLWNNARMLNPWEAFRVVSKMDCSAKAAIVQVLLNVARVENTRVRLDILRQLCSPSQCGLPYQLKSMPSPFGLFK